MEMENRWSPRGVGGAGLGLGIAGTALGVLNGGLGNVLGGYGCNHAMYACNETVPVTRYDLSREQRISELEQKLSLTEASVYTDSKLNDFRNYVDNRFGGIEAQLCQQAVYNATATSNLACLQAQVAALQGLTKVVIPIDNICPQPATATA